MFGFHKFDYGKIGCGKTVTKNACDGEADDGELIDKKSNALHGQPHADGSLNCFGGFIGSPANANQVTHLNSPPSDAARDATSNVRPPHRQTRHRPIKGASAILLPFDGTEVDWAGFDAHVRRTFDAGLTPAINMDTGYANLIDADTATRALDRSVAIAAGRDLIAGVYVADAPGEPVNLDAYHRGVADLSSRGITAILFQSYGLTEQTDEQIIKSYREIGGNADRMLFFELGSMFADFGKIYSLDVYRELMQIPSMIGAKHSSLSRQPEWDRIELRNEIRPDFSVMTGNDLAIDMVMYGSDYLLGLSTFAPMEFAARDRYWAEGDPRFYELNDLLQYLGAFAFRRPVSAYKHSAAMFLKMRGWITDDSPHPDAHRRPDSDREVLRQILEDLNRLVEPS